MLVAGAALVAVLAADVGPAGATRNWLDAEALPAWNAPGAPLPRAPRPQGEPPWSGRCAGQARPPADSADRAVIEAGWTPVGAQQRFGDTTVLSAASDADGMCRPLAVQVFVFVEGRFAGTLSPTPMGSREDGVATQVVLVSPGRIWATFARYAPRDPLCCPSRSVEVVFEVQREAGGPAVAPIQLSTRAVSPER
jgi:LppP/LprE lipoprotein